MILKEQELIAKVLDMFAQKFNKKAVLCGGMVLRILGSQRFTNDLDYVFVPYKSKKDIVGEILECLGALEGAELQYELNSKCLRVFLTLEGVTIQIESKVAMDVRSMAVSTKLVSQEFNLPPRIIHVVDLNVALADKMAAWNERRLIRDIYDIWFFLQMKAKPDLPTLEARLAKPSYSKLVGAKNRFHGKTCEDFYSFIHDAVNNLDDRQIRNELSDYLPAAEIVGLSLLFKSAFALVVAEQRKRGF